MDNDLSCNVRKCHKKLTMFAWVTSCSHIFCDDCAKSSFGRGNTCSACSEKLQTKNDVQRVELQPTEQYKSMILAGLKPEIIMEISSRALSFWTYQAYQEKIHLDATVKALKENRQLMEQHYVQLNNHAQTEFSSLNSQLSASKKEIETMKQQMTEISDKLTEKSRQYQKLQSLYDALRRNCIVAQQSYSQEHERLERDNTVPRPVNGFEPFVRPKTRPSSDLRAASPYMMRVGLPAYSPRDQQKQRVRPAEGNLGLLATAIAEPEFSFGQFTLVPPDNQLRQSPKFNDIQRLF